jgi:hypothetical protein
MVVNAILLSVRTPLPRGLGWGDSRLLLMLLLLEPVGIDTRVYVRVYQNAGDHESLQLPYLAAIVPASTTRAGL